MFYNYHIKNFNFRLLIYVLLLNSLGVLVIRSATGQDASLVGRQIIGILAGVVIASFLSLVDYHRILKFSGILYLICCILLIGVLIVGKKVGGARRWIILPFIGQLQPSEFVKIGLVLFFSWFLTKYQDNINSPATLGLAMVLIGFPLFMILKEPDLSTSLVVLFSMACMIFIAGLSYKWILGIFAFIIPVAALFLYLIQYDLMPFLQTYQKRRILAWIYPAEYADSNYQQLNSIMAIGSGQLSGKGLNNNTLASVKNGNFLSEEQTDFIFAVVGEELGFIGCALVICLFALVVFECLYMASRAKDLQGKLICIGIASMLSFQMFSNIAVATGIFPNTGLPLPFVSYGVSSLISLYVGIGLVLNIGMQRRGTAYKEVYEL